MGGGGGDMKFFSFLKGATEILVTFVGGTTHFHESQSNSRSFPGGILRMTGEIHARLK